MLLEIVKHIKEHKQTEKQGETEGRLRGRVVFLLAQTLKETNQKSIVQLGCLSLTEMHKL